MFKKDTNLLREINRKTGSCITITTDCFSIKIGISRGKKWDRYIIDNSPESKEELIKKLKKTYRVYGDTKYTL